MSIIRLLQVTDCHLQQSAAQEFHQVNPDQRLLETFATCRQQRYDHLLLSGDLVHHGYPEAYLRLTEYSEGLATHSHWIPGNHDDAAMVAAAGHPTPKVVEDGNWTLLLLDSTAHPDGVGSGSLGKQALTNLEKAINSVATEHLLIALHHPPVAIGSPWQDQIMLGDAEQLWQLLAKTDKLRGVIFGHLHQHHQRLYRGVQLFCSAASVNQFCRYTQSPEREQTGQLALPGFRSYELHPDGKIYSQAHRVASGRSVR